MAAYSAAGASTPLRELRRLAGLSREQLAVRAGVGVTALARAEHGGLPTLRVARALAAALGVRVSECFPEQKPGDE